ncbi:MAG: isoprenyl transferase [Clostridium baratii]|uniref:Isoprenyl transferase n=1 Tax=Clostridium baratii str. Sullivan TaxID=1415775 RepID=A0A0A7FSB2_9CLOT|nr:isoprenyl transferase [Clostridium baratii]AIY82507.1 di-trans,poly-cis-decaprenylcistransferase [Clostridium baratii str. Sullivan]MBS6006742.1 isoprenyl transferase [Clostridium baratii]MDU4910371.1 isoprenyl transferase [Clostridium baratii]CUP00140.1 di-trans%2Cpoly-cis-decaprenylcistransferase [Clostridium baratii]
MLKFFKGEKTTDNEEISLDMENIPKHIAIIMDGNGRWAKKRKLPRTMGHKAGVETIRRVLKEADKLGVKYMTLYAFSTENWKRPKEEVNALMKLLIQYLRQEINELHKNGVKINVLGDITKLPKECQEEIEKSVDKTKNNVGITMNIALNYGGRDEILRAVKSISEEVLKGNINIEDINDEVMENYLYTKGVPDPDIIIRPSGEQRLSNFLLWQCAYSEFWYSDICWPDFKEEDLHRAIYDFQRRDRRFGGVK